MIVHEKHLFDGIVVKTPAGDRFVDAPEVDEIYERLVTLKIDGDEVAELPKPESQPRRHEARREALRSAGGARRLWRPLRAAASAPLPGLRRHKSAKQRPDALRRLELRVMPHVGPAPGAARRASARRSAPPCARPRRGRACPTRTDAARRFARARPSSGPVAAPVLDVADQAVLHAVAVVPAMRVPRRPALSALGARSSATRPEARPRAARSVPSRRQGAGPRVQQQLLRRQGAVDVRDRARR